MLLNQLSCVGVPALGHAWVEDEGNYPASCTEPGHMSFHCDRPGCLETKGGDIPALHPEGHKMEPFSINTSTCTIGGYLTTGQKCAYCGYTENTKDEPVDKLGHSMKETEQKVDWRSRVIYQNGRPAVVNEEVFYVTRECTRCGYCAPGHLYTVARSEQLSRYKIETGNVKVKDLDEGSGGVKVSGQFGKDSGVYFNKTVNDAYQSRKEIDRKVYEQHEGSINITFTEDYLSSLENGEYDFIYTNGDELAAARVTVEGGRITGVEDGVISTYLTDERKTQLNGQTEEQWAAYLGEEESGGFLMTDGEYQFYLGVADRVTVLTAPDAALTLGANADPYVEPGSAEYDTRSGQGKDVATIKYDNGHVFAGLTHLGETIPAQVYVVEGDTGTWHDTYQVSADTDKITFTKEYLSTLGEGVHEFEFNYADGKQALFFLTVAKGTTPIGPTPTYGGGSSPTTYAPTITETANGKVTVKPEKAASGELVTITATPDEGYELDALTVTDTGGKEVALTKSADCTFSFVQPAGKVTIKATFKKTADSDENCPMKAFIDLDPAAWYHDGVHWALENGVMNGVGGGKFDPSGATTRGMIVTILYRLEGEPVIRSGMPFSDVKESDWYAKAISWAESLGIVNGYGDGRFGPNDPITREQLATILYRYAQHKGEGFKGLWNFKLDFPDAGEVSVWAIEAVSWMVMNGVINGKDGKLVPGGNASRAEAATMLQRFSAKIAE
jgi:hypothetical protein